MPPPCRVMGLVRKCFEDVHQNCGRVPQAQVCRMCNLSSWPVRGSAEQGWEMVWCFQWSHLCFSELETAAWHRFLLDCTGGGVRAGWRRFLVADPAPMFPAWSIVEHQSEYLLGGHSWCVLQSAELTDNFFKWLQRSANWSLLRAGARPAPRGMWLGAWHNVVLSAREKPRGNLWYSPLTDTWHMSSWMKIWICLWVKLLNINWSYSVVVVMPVHAVSCRNNGNVSVEVVEPWLGVSAMLTLSPDNHSLLSHYLAISCTITTISTTRNHHSSMSLLNSNVHTHTLCSGFGKC